MKTPGIVVHFLPLALFALAVFFTQSLPAAEESPTAAVKKLYENLGCATCHGEDGRTPRNDTTPIIAGQLPRYSYLVLRAYKSGERQGAGSAQHAEVSDLLSDLQMKQLADYIAALK